MCDGCEACYHGECVEIDQIPEGKWFCKVCQSHLTSDAIDLVTMTKSMDEHAYRIPLLGRDRNGRMYWFFAKRIFV